MLDFHKLQKAVRAQFDRMAKDTLFCVQIDKHAMWENYLNSFPEGTNQVYRTRREYDCSCCKNFVRTVGHVVTINEFNEYVTIWDKNPGDPAFQQVCDAMATLIKSKPIDNLFLHSERKVGTDHNYQNDNQRMVTWNHFSVELPKKNDRSCIVAGKDQGTIHAKQRSAHDVLLRALREIKPSAVTAVLELIKTNSIYRGTEFKPLVTSFQKLQKEFLKLKPELESDERDNFVWVKIHEVGEAVAFFRTSVIGTLVVDLSEDFDLEDAVRMYESKVAPENYKRTTSLVTKEMITKAKAKIDALGLESALERRYATIEDLSVNNIIFADRTSKKLMKGNVFDELSSAIPVQSRSLEHVDEVPIETFIAEILPKAKSLEVMVENKHASNLVSLVAPVDPKANNLFKWDNGFSWSYKGEVTDAIKERVKQAGGNVTGDVCCRLAWWNYDDLDFHMIEPRGGCEIYFSNRRSVTGGQLDVDMNAGGGSTRVPVENIFYPSWRAMKNGVHKLFVHQFSRRETTNPGFTVDIDVQGTIHTFEYPKMLKQGEKVAVADLQKTADGVLVIPTLTSKQASREVWNVQTQTFQKVNVVLNSPNHWDSKGVGNKHYFFMIDGCRNEETARGFYNEFLKEELNEHRKVFEMVGSKMQTDKDENQLSGLGFSSTMRNSVLCKVDGSIKRTVKVVF